MLSLGSVTEIGSFNRKRKSFVLFLGPFRGPFFHQGLEWFLFVLFLAVFAFAHVSRSLYLGLIGCFAKQRIAYRSFAAPHAPTPPL
jgi:hypothetical protein